MINQPISFASRKHNVNNNKRHNKKPNIAKNNPNINPPIQEIDVQIIQPKQPKAIDMEHLDYMPKEIRDEIKASQKEVLPVLIEQTTVETPEQTSKKSHSYKNALMGSLMALATIAAPVAIMLDDNNDDYYYTTSSPFVYNNSTNGTEDSVPSYDKELSNKSMEEYQRDFITCGELTDCLDYSKIKKYQKDVTVLNALLSGNFARIRRDDPERSEKFGKAIEEAQATIDKIAHKYEMNSRIVGNDDYDNTISREEMVGALDLSSIKDLSDKEQVSIVKKAMNNVKPFMFSELQDIDDIKKTNQQLCERLQVIQNTVDADARKALCKKYGIKESDLK